MMWTATTFFAARAASASLATTTIASLATTAHAGFLISSLLSLWMMIMIVHNFSLTRKSNVYSIAHMK